MTSTNRTPSGPFPHHAQLTPLLLIGHRSAPEDPLPSPIRVFISSHLSRNHDYHEWFRSRGWAVTNCETVDGGHVYWLR